MSDQHQRSRRGDRSVDLQSRQAVCCCGEPSADAGLERTESQEDPHGELRGVSRNSIEAPSAAWGTRSLGWLIGRHQLGGRALQLWAYSTRTKRCLSSWEELDSMGQRRRTATHTTMPLPQHIERDQRAYNRQKDRLIAGYCGRIALFHDGTFIDTYASNREAYLDGCSKFGLGHFSLITVGDETAIDVGILGMCMEQN